MTNLTETIITRIDPKTKQLLIHQAEWRNLKLAQLTRLALSEWLAWQRGMGTPILQRRRDVRPDDN